MMWFQPPVILQDVERRPGLLQNVNSVAKAAELLLEWKEERGKRGRKITRAMNLCIQALEGKGTPEKVRAAFEAAAEEAGMWVKK